MDPLFVWLEGACGGIVYYPHWRENGFYGPRPFLYCYKGYNVRIKWK